MDVIGEARELEPDEEVPPPRDRQSGPWVDAFGIGAFGLSLVSAVGPSGALFLGMLRSETYFGVGGAKSLVDFLGFVGANVGLAAAALVLAVLAVMRSDDTTPRWSGALARGAVVVSVVVLVVLAAMGAWYVLEDLPNPEDEFVEELAAPR